MPDEKNEPEPEAKSERKVGPKPEPKSEFRAPALELPPVGTVVRYVPPKGDRAVTAILVAVTPTGAADLKVTPRVMPRLGHLANGVVRRAAVPYSKELRQGHWSP